MVVKGELTFDTVVDALRQASPLFGTQGDVKLDLRSVKRIDSAGLSLLIEWVRQLRRQQRRLTVLNPPHQLGRLAKISGVNDIFTVDTIVQ